MNEDDYQEKLSPEAFAVCRQSATERPFSGRYNDFWEEGVYHCVCCNEALFSSQAKFNAGCGWPSFFDALPEKINYLVDQSHGMVRTEIKCLACDSHLGHVFDDGPKPTGKRYCVNSLSLLFSKNT